MHTSGNSGARIVMGEHRSWKLSHPLAMSAANFRRQH